MFERGTDVPKKMENEQMNDVTGNKVGERCTDVGNTFRLGSHRESALWKGVGNEESTCCRLIGSIPNIDCTGFELQRNSICDC